MQIHTYEDKGWTMKGKYATAVDDDDEISWMKINQDYVLPMWLVSSIDCVPINIDYFKQENDELRPGSANTPSSA